MGKRAWEGQIKETLRDLEEVRAAVQLYIKVAYILGLDHQQEIFSRVSDALGVLYKELKLAYGAKKTKYNEAVAKFNQSMSDVEKFYAKPISGKSKPHTSFREWLKNIGLKQSIQLVELVDKLRPEVSLSGANHASLFLSAEKVSDVAPDLSTPASQQCEEKSRISFDWV